MNDLEKRTKIGWKDAWKITKMLAEPVGYFGFMGLGYYLGSQIDEGGVGALVFGVVACYHQDAKNGEFDNNSEPLDEGL